LLAVGWYKISASSTDTLLFTEDSFTCQAFLFYLVKDFLMSIPPAF